MKFKRCIRCGLKRTIRYFLPHPTAPDGRLKTCTVCLEAARKQRAERARSNQATRFCRKCADLPHRREKPVCPRCGKPWEPEAAAPGPNGWQRRYYEPGVLI